MKEAEAIIRLFLISYDQRFTIPCGDARPSGLY